MHSASRMPEEYINSRIARCLILLTAPSSAEVSSRVRTTGNFSGTFIADMPFITSECGAIMR